MENVQDILRKVHVTSQKKNQPKEYEEPSPEVVNDNSEGFNEQDEKIHVLEQSVKKKTTQDQSMYPKSVLKLARRDIPIEKYSKNRLQLGFSPLNREVRKWVKNFSEDNQDNGGISIGNSDLVEICLDVMIYDLGIKPKGYHSLQELRRDIQERMKKY